MIVRSSKFLLLFFAATLLGAALFAAVGAWQLSRGPVSLAFLTPIIEDSLSGGQNDVQVRLHDTVLTWAGLERTLDIRAVGLEVLDSDGEVAASVPEMSVRFSLRALARGIVAPTVLELFGPRLRIIRSPDGEVVMGIGAVSGADQSDRSGMELVAGLLREPNLDSSTGYLRNVSIVSALIDFEDQKTGQNWTAQRADISLERDDQGIRADGTIVLDAGGKPARFEVSGLISTATQSVDLGVSFDDLTPATLAALDPRLAQLDRVRLPVSGTIALSLSSSLAVENVSFDLTGGDGEIVAPELYSAPLPVGRIVLRGGAADEMTKLVIDEASVEVGGPTVSVSGEVTRDGEAIDIQLDTRATAVPANDLQRLWPPEVGVGARRWITKNIKDGVVDVATFSVAASLDLNDLEAIDLRRAVGEFNVRGATVHYLRPMTPIKMVTGRGRFDGVDLVMDFTEGGIGGLTIQSGRVAIGGLTGDAPVEVADIDATISGPAREALALLDEDPLKFISPFGIDPARTDGTQTTRATFKFPLLDALSMDDVDVAASVQLEKFSAPAVVFGDDLTEGDLTLAVDKVRLIATGNAALAGIPLKLTWTENFTDKTALRTRYEVQTVLDDAGQEHFGLGIQPLLSGPVGVGLTYEIAVDGGEKGAALLNLMDATMSLTDFGWEKFAGEMGEATVEFSGRDGLLREISKISVATAGLTAEGTGKLTNGEDGLTLSELTFEHLAFGESDVFLRVGFGTDSGRDVLIGGEKLDLRPAMKDAFADGDEKPPAMRIRFAQDNPLRAIRLGDETVLQTPTGRLRHDGNDWHTVNLQGELSKGGQIDLRLQTLDEGRKVTLTSDNGGNVLSALDWIDTIEGGAMRVEGTFVTRDGEEVFVGQGALEDFKVNESSIMARILSLASFSGITDALAGSGITIRRAEVPFEVTDEEIRIGEAKARGADIGVLATGGIDRVAKQVDIQGEIAPAYTLNSIFSNIPVLGTLLTGGGDAIFAATFKVSGPVEDPKVSVNPLSVLTPGILRRLVSGFGNGEGTEEGSSEPAPAPAGAE